MKLFYKYGAIYFFLLMLWGCSSIPTPSQVYQGKTVKEICTVAENGLAKENFADAVQAYEALDTLYPYGHHIQQAHLNMIYAYYKNNDNASAIAAADRYIRLYPQSSNLDYAYYLKGLANYDVDRGWLDHYLPTDPALRDPSTLGHAFTIFSKLVNLFPNSLYAPDARQRMIYLRNMFARYELRVAQYYFDREAYVAAANRASYVVAHYHSSPAVREALIILVKANKKLGLTKAANDALQLLNLNYPGIKIKN
ncbi:MAG: Outer membrane protein assembly factor BamD [Legionellaceae bacterium]